MPESRKLLTAAADKLGVPINVGTKGGDLPTRYVAAIVLAALTAAMWLGASAGALKIGALLIGMSGTIMLMAGLVFSQTTHFAGIFLTFAPFLMLAATMLGLRWLGILIGLGFVAAIAFNIITKRCGLNKFFGIISLDEEEVCATNF